MPGSIPTAIHPLGLTPVRLQWLRYNSAAGSTFPTILAFAPWRGQVSLDSLVVSARFTVTGDLLGNRVVGCISARPNPGYTYGPGLWLSKNRGWWCALARTNENDPQLTKTQLKDTVSSLDVVFTARYITANGSTTSTTNAFRDKIKGISSPTPPSFGFIHGCDTVLYRAEFRDGAFRSTLLPARLGGLLGTVDEVSGCFTPLRTQRGFEAGPPA